MVNPSFLKRSIVCLLTYSLLTTAYGQNQKYRFRHLTADDGLSSSWVTSIVKDQKGFIWIGTNNGLNRYDGYQFEVFKSDAADSSSLYSNEILALFVDHKGTLWIGTSKGVNIYNNKTNSFLRKHNLTHQKIYDIKGDSNGNILVGSDGLHIYKPSGQIVSYYQGDGPCNLSNQTINRIFIDSQKRIWIGTQYGLNLFNIEKDTFLKYYHSSENKLSLPGNDIRSITEDKSGKLWIGTTEGFASFFIGENAVNPVIRIYTEKSLHNSQLGFPNIMAVHCDKKNNLWIGTQNGGLNILPLNREEDAVKEYLHFNSEAPEHEGLNNNSVHCILEDNSENIWLGTFSGGINLYCPKAKQFNLFSHIPHSQKSVNNKHVNTFYEDGDLLWIGTEGGLNCYHKKNRIFRYYVHDVNDVNSLGANAVWAIHKDDYGDLWIGTWAGGLNRFSKSTGKFIHYQHDPSDSNSISNNNIRCLYPDEDGSLWIGTMGGGLSHYLPETHEFRNYHTANSDIRTNYVLSILGLSGNQLLISNVNGVVMFDKTKKSFSSSIFDIFIGVKTKELIVFTLFIDSERNIWFGSESGLFVINEDSSVYKYYKKELSNISVKSILEDHHGNLWLGTNDGLVKFLNAIKLPEKPLFIEYSVDDGLQGNEFIYRSCLKGSDGTMYFGGINGFNVFHPDSIKEYSDSLYVVITDFLLFNKPVDIGDNNSPLVHHISETDEIKLNYKQNSFSFKYVGLNYISPDKTVYAYQLEGFDTDWKYVNNLREAVYTNIRPGKYRFKVKAAYNENDWGHPAETISLTITPPFWFTLYAYIFYGIILTGILFLYFKYTIIRITRKNQLLIDHLNYSKQEEINQAKLHFFTNLSHEIRTPLTLISAPLENILKNGNKVNLKEQITLISQNVKRLLNLVNQLLDFRKIDVGGEKLMISYQDMSKMVKEIANAFQTKEGRLSQQIIIKNDSEVFGWFDSEKMTTVFYNLISNALKYNRENGRITIEISKTKSDLISFGKKSRKTKKQTELIEVRITDEGTGIPEDQLKQIFDRYYQAFRSNSVWLRGSGIGLNITREYIELHGGKIWAENNQDRGSTFIFQFPAGTAPIKSNPEKDDGKSFNHELIKELLDHENTKVDKTAVNQSLKFEIAGPDKKQLILLVEDNPELINFLEDNLRNSYLVLKAYNGNQGIDLAKKYSPDIIISDIIMPDTDGIKMIQKLRCDLDTSHIPIIILSAKSMDEAKLEGIETGADAYLTKPFNMELLRAYIVTILDSRKKLKEKYSRKLTLEPGDITISSTDEKFMKRLMEIVEANIANIGFNVNDLSDEMNVSYRVIARKIKSLTNQTLNEFIRSMRLKRAAVILCKGHLPITEVSLLTGFNDPAYFSRCFQKQFGISPSQYTETKMSENHKGDNKSFQGR